MGNKFLNSIVLAVFITTYSSLFTGCGYKPTTSYIKDSIRGNVYVDIDVNLEDPKNSVLIKDAMHEIVLSRFKNKLVYKKWKADSILHLKLRSVGLSVLQYDADGYVKLYRANANIAVNYRSFEKSGTFIVSGNYDFAIDDGTVISDTKRFDAIRMASSKALEEVISKLALESFKTK